VADNNQNHDSLSQHYKNTCKTSIACTHIHNHVIYPNTIVYTTCIHPLGTPHIMNILHTYLISIQ